jgi:8-oxo-dGTP pyrophosphatase MutT (NUDIX family)
MTTTELTPRDGSFVVIYRNTTRNLEEIEFLLGCNANDSLFELLGGGFDLSDFTPDVAACREVLEETDNQLFIDKNKLTYFAHMIQKLPKLGEYEKGSVFCFFYKYDEHSLSIKPSIEHSELVWCKFSDLLSKGEKVYRTSTLRIIFHFFNYLSTKKIIFGILGQKVKFMNYEF